MKTVNIYTDGACSGNQNEENTGGWGCVLEYGGHEKELFGGEENTTNNRMELFALISALQALKVTGLNINIYSDSSYLVNCFKNRWYDSWQKNGWKTSKKTPVENRELWEQLISLLAPHTVNFFLVKGHVNAENQAAVDKAFDNFCKHNGPVERDRFVEILRYNSRCDELATRFQRGKTEEAE